MRRAARIIVGLVAAAIVTVIGASTASAVPAHYVIDIRTCNVNNAGTDSDVEAKLHGTGGDTGWVVLDNPGDDRERGRTDHYAFDLVDVGPITAITLDYMEEAHLKYGNPETVPR